MRTAKIPVEVRMWLPDGETMRIRSYLSEFTIDTDAGTIPVELMGIVPISRWYMLRMEGPAWEKDRHGRPKGEKE